MLLDANAPEISLEASVKTFGAIRKVFERVCHEVVFDQHLAKRVISFQIGFANKNEDHIAFFGGVLTGVHVVRMTPQDMNTFFMDVVQVNEIELEEELHALPVIKPDANTDRKISGSVFNQVCLWLMHGFMTSKHLSPPARLRAAQAAALILNYRYLTSLLVWYYKTPASLEYAQAAYARLTKRSAIKQFGSWHALLENRCLDFLDPKGLHYKTVMGYEEDAKIVYALNDSQGRIRSMMKHLMGELKTAHEEGTKVKTTGATVELDGEGFLKDVASNLTIYVNYIFTTLSDENTFIKQELLKLIKEVVYTAPPALVFDTLQWMTQAYKTPRGKDIDPFVQKLLEHSFSYLAENSSVMKKSNDIGAMLLKLKGVYTSSRSTEPRLFELRDLSERIVKQAVKTKNPSVIASIKTSIMLYVVLRAYTMHYYSRG